MNSPFEQKRYQIGEWVDIWMHVYAEPELQPSTTSSYKYTRNTVRKFFPDFEKKQLGELRPMEFQQMLTVLADHYAKSTLRNVKLIYNRAYTEAIRNDLCPTNPIRDTVIPKKATQKKIEGLTQQEEEKLLSILPELTPLGQSVLLAFLFTGLRRSELQSLVWGDWNRQKQKLFIRKSKTEKGVRTISVLPELAWILTERYTQRSKHTNLIFHNQGRPLGNTYLKKLCYKASALAGIRRLTPHMLRHTFASRALEAGMEPQSLAEILGHTNVAFTIRQYVTLDQSYLAEQMQKISSFYKARFGSTTHLAPRSA